MVTPIFLLRQVSAPLQHPVITSHSLRDYCRFDCCVPGVSVSKVVRHQVQGSTFRTQRAMGCSITSTARALPRTRHILNPVGSHWTMCLSWYNGTTASSDAAKTHRVYVSHTHHAHISAHAHTRLIMVSSVDSLCLQKIDTYTAFSILV